MLLQGSADHCLIIIYICRRRNSSTSTKVSKVQNHTILVDTEENSEVEKSTLRSLLVYNGVDR